MYMAAIFFVSGMHQAPLPENVSDKSAHSAAYFLLGVLVVRAVHGGLPARVLVRGALLTLLITVGYGASDEVHQRFVAGRSADVLDLRADAIGAMGAVLVCWAWGILARTQVPDA